MIEDVYAFNRIALIANLIISSLVCLVLPMVRHRLTTGEGSGFVISKVTDPVGKYVGMAMTIQTSALMVWCVVFGIFGPDALGVWKIFPLSVSFLGIALIWLAAIITSTAQAQMGKAWRMCIDEEQKALVTHGFFRYVRNPIYSCTILVVIGVFLLSPSPWTLWLISNAIVFVSIQARLEENFLLETHGEEYRAYAQKVGRFLPGIGLIAK